MTTPMRIDTLNVHFIAVVANFAVRARIPEVFECFAHRMHFPTSHRMSPHFGRAYRNQVHGYLCGASYKTH
jgi:hypothetical protein